jgi:hypothetical protein
MATGWRSVLCAAAVVMGGASVQGQIAVLPLVDAADPIRLSDATFDGADPERPAITMRLENMTNQPFSTDRIWISLLRFYTPDETRQRNDRKIWDCGLMARANHDDPKQALELLPGASLQIRMSLVAGCGLNPQHEHFSAEVSRISIPASPRFAYFEWKREAVDHSRLLLAAMSKAR